MGLIFKDITDDQREAMMETTYVGITWQMRYLRIKYVFWGAVACTVSAGVTAATDYAIAKTTDFSGIIGWLLA